MSNTDYQDTQRQSTVYAELARQFNDQTGIGVSETQNTWETEASTRYEVLDEERLELRREVYPSETVERDRVAEELADVVVTAFSMADSLGIDLRRAYERKMVYNLKKTGSKDDNGKVTDDAAVEKPTFDDCV